MGKKALRYGEEPGGIIRVPGLPPTTPPAGIRGVTIPAHQCKFSDEYRPLRRPNRTRPLDPPAGD